MTELERLREKAAQKRLKLEYERGRSGVHHYRLRDTKHGTLAFTATAAQRPRSSSTNGG